MRNILILGSALSLEKSTTFQESGALSLDIWCRYYRDDFPFFYKINAYLGLLMGELEK